MRIKFGVYVTTRLLAFFISTVISLYPLSSHSATLFTAEYEGEYSGWNIKLKRQLIENEGQFEFTSEADNLFASINESSVFSLKGNNMLPSEYQYLRKIFGRKTLEKIEFNWPKNQAQYTRSDREKNNTTHDIDFPTLDPSLYQLNLQADLANQVPKLQYQFVKRKRIKHYEFIRQNEAEYKFNKKNYKAILVKRSDEDKGKTTRVWVLPDLDYQIAKIEHEDEDGDTFSIILKDYQSDSGQVMTFYQKLKMPESKKAKTTTNAPDVTEPTKD